MRTVRQWSLFALLLGAISAQTVRADVLVSASGGDFPTVYRFDDDGNYVSNFTDSEAAPFIESFEGLAFGPDGNLYVANNALGMGNVLRFDGQTGAYIDEFVPLADNGLSAPANITFGPDDNLYVTSRGFGAGVTGIFRYDGATGAFIDIFVPAGSPGVGDSDPYDLVFRSDGTLLVSGNNFSAEAGPTVSSTTTLAAIS